MPQIQLNLPKEVLGLLQQESDNNFTTTEIEIIKRICQSFGYEKLSQIPSLSEQQTSPIQSEPPPPETTKPPQPPQTYDPDKPITNKYQPKVVIEDDPADTQHTTINDYYDEELESVILSSLKPDAESSAPSANFDPLDLHEMSSRIKKTKINKM